MNFIAFLMLPPVPHNYVFWDWSEQFRQPTWYFQKWFQTEWWSHFISGIVFPLIRQHSYTLDALDFSIHASFRFLRRGSFAYSVTSVMATPHQMRPSQFLSLRNQPAFAPDISPLAKQCLYSQFNPLTNARPQRRTNTLFSVNPPSLGSVSNDASRATLLITASKFIWKWCFSITSFTRNGKGGLASAM